MTTREVSQDTTAELPETGIVGANLRQSGDRASKSQHFVLLICTRGRPQMLANCLRSVVNLKTIDAWSLEVVIIDNDEAPGADQIVSSFAETSSFPIFYTHEAKTGIPQARNHGLQYALARNADFIGFIDDDEMISEHWLQAMFEAFQEFDCDVVQAPVNLSYETSAPSWIKKEKKKDRQTGDILKTAATDNVAFKARLVSSRPHGLALRFDEDMRYTGGSDTDFFFKAADVGANIIWSNSAAITELVPAARTTLKWQFQRFYRTEVNAVGIYMARKGFLRAFFKYLPKIILKFALALLMGVQGVTQVPFYKEAAHRSWFNAGKKVSAALGAIGGLLKLRPDVYRQTDGK